MKYFLKKLSPSKLTVTEICVLHLKSWEHVKQTNFLEVYPHREQAGVTLQPLKELI